MYKLLWAFLTPTSRLKDKGICPFSRCGLINTQEGRRHWFQLSSGPSGSPPPGPDRLEARRRRPPGRCTRSPQVADQIHRLLVKIIPCSDQTWLRNCTRIRVVMSEYRGGGGIYFILFFIIIMSLCASCGISLKDFRQCYK